MAAIDVGSAAVDGNSRGSTAYTYVSKDNPANLTGLITSVEIWANSDMTGCEVASCSASGNDLTTRDSEALGNVTAGSKQTFSGLSIDINSGDYIAYYSSSGWIENDNSGGAGIWYLSGDHIPCTSETFTWLADYAQSLYGIGATISAPTVTTQAVSSVGTTTATGNGNITDTGGEDASAWGTCLATTANPDTGDTVDAGSGAGGTGAFTTSIDGLSSPVKYHVRAYATNSAGTSYGADVTFITKCSTTANLSLAPTIAKSWGRTMTVSTALSLTPTVVMAKGWEIVTSTALSVATSISKAVAYARATSSSLSLTPTISRVVAYVRTASSNLSLTTTIARVFNRTKTVSCALSLTPTISKVVAYVRTTSSNLSLTPTISRAMTYTKTVSSSLSLTPTISRVVTYTKAISSNLSLTTTVNRVVAYARATSSNLSLAATIVRTFGWNITTSCNLSLTTTINRVAAYTRAVSTNLSLTTAISKVVAYARAISSSLSLTTTIAYIVHRWKKIKDFTGRAIRSFTGRDIQDDSDQFRDIKNP